MRVVVFALALFGCACALPVSVPASDKGTPVFAVVMTRHGVRSFTHPSAAYSWPDWSPVGPGFLTAHGYRLATQLGQYYRSYFASAGLPVNCAAQSIFVYADLDQRTLETGKALIEGACGSPNGVPLYHDAKTGPNVNDPLFDGADWLVPAGKVDASASTASVVAVAPNPSALVASHASDFAALQSILNARCAGSCPPVTGGESTISTEKGLAGVRGPIDNAASYAESLFLEQAQCAAPIDDDELEAAMRLHVIEYDVNSRNGYNSHVKGGNIFAHIVGMLEAKAGMPHPDVDLPDLSRASVAILSGHDTQLGALGGILDAHWPLGNGIVADDMPPGGAMVFELYRTAPDAFTVHLHVVYQTLAQLRSGTAFAGGIATSPVHFAGCDANDCSIPLEKLAAMAHAIVKQGFVQRAWTDASDAEIPQTPLQDPPWTRCR